MAPYILIFKVQLLSLVITYLLFSLVYSILFLYFFYFTSTYTKCMRVDGAFYVIIVGKYVGTEERAIQVL